MRQRLIATIALVGLAGALSALSPPSATAQESTGAEVALANVTQVSGGGSHTCARLANGQARCWGVNTYGQLGDGSTNPDPNPVVVQNPAGTGPLTGVVSIAAGYEHTCAVLNTGQARCWGVNDEGQLGTGNTNERHRPTAVKNPAGTGPLQNVRQIVASSGEHSCALLANGEARCWGDGDSGDLGNGNTAQHELPVIVKAPVGVAGPLTGILQIDLGVDFTCALVGGGQVRCFGDNVSGQLGQGNFVDSSRPIAVKKPAGQVGPLSGVTQIGVGDDGACARLNTGQVRCWGEGDDGTNGDGAGVDRKLPVVVKNLAGGGPLTGVTALTQGNEHTCARLGNGQVRCWGRNSDGQVGNDSTSQANLPKIVKNVPNNGALATVTQVSAGDAHTCARLGNGQIRCWGDNQYGQAGDGTDSNDRPVAVAVQL